MNYDEMTKFISPQVISHMETLAKAVSQPSVWPGVILLKVQMNPDLIEKYRGTESLPFAIKDNTQIAVKIVDDRGIESLKVISVGANG